MRSMDLRGGDFALISSTLACIRRIHGDAREFKLILYRNIYALYHGEFPPLLRR